MPARLIFSTGSLYVADLAHCFALAADAGCDGVEVMCDDRWSTRDPNYLRTLSRHYALPILVVHTPFSTLLPGWPQARDPVARIQHTLALANALDAETIVVHLPHKVGLATLQLPAQRLRFPWRTPDTPIIAWIRQHLSVVQQQTAIKIALENMPGQRVAGKTMNATYWNTVDEWSTLHRYLTMDTTHWATLKIDPLHAYTTAKKQICHVHLSNYDGREHRLPQHGQLNLAALLEVMAADRYDGTISLELHPDALDFTDTERCRQLLRESVIFCRHHLGQTLQKQVSPFAAP